MNNTTKRNEDILNVCKYCDCFTDNRKNRDNCRCEKYRCIIYDANKCGRLSSTYRFWLGGEK